jgi:hypothetical protein
VCTPVIVRLGSPIRMWVPPVSVEIFVSVGVPGEPLTSTSLTGSNRS